MLSLGRLPELRRVRRLRDYGVQGLRDLGEHVAHAKDAVWILDIEFFSAVAGPADAGILYWVGSDVGKQECVKVVLESEA